MPKKKSSLKPKPEGSNNVTLATKFQLAPRKPKGRWGEQADYEYEAARQTTDFPGSGEASNIKMKVDVTDTPDKYIHSLSPQAANIRAWEGLTHEAKMLAIETSKKLKVKGKMIIHSAFRSEGQSKEAMQKVGSLKIYRKKWRDALTPKQLSSEPIGPKSSKEDKKLRTSAVQAMWDAGFRSQHGSSTGVGSAFDISYKGMTGKKYPGKWKTPSGQETKAARAVKAKLKTPKAKVILEHKPLHIHMESKKRKW